MKPITTWNDSDVEDYHKFVSSIAEFITNAMYVLQQQKETMIVLTTELQRHLQIATVQQSVIRDMSTQLLAHKTLLIEHESRVIDLESAMYNGDYTRRIILKKPN